MNATLLIAFAAATQTFSLPPGLLSALCYVETSHNPKAIHKDDGKGDSIGLCQVKLATAQMLGYKGTARGLLDPKTNVYYAAAYLTLNMKRYNRDIRKAVAAYNAGTHREDSKGLTRNRKYVSKVFKAWSEDK